MTIEQLAQMENYYFPNNELSADDFEFVLANLPRSAKRASFSRDDRLDPRWLSYDILDYYDVLTRCDELNCNSQCVLFSARYRCIKYVNQDDQRIKYIDFTKELFNPQGDPISHSITVGKYQFFFERPIKYNILMILLKWSDLQYENKKLPVIGRLDAQPVFISSEVQTRYSVDVDIKTSVPLAVGYGELTILDKYFVRSESVLKGGLFFYLGNFRNYNIECTSIEELIRSSILDAPTPIIAVSPSPYGNNRISRDYLETVYYFKHDQNFRIFGNEDRHLLYVVDNKDDYYLELCLFSKRDYYSVGAWLIVTLACLDCPFDDKYLKIRESWPTCPILTKESGKGTTATVGEKGIHNELVLILKPFYKAFKRVLPHYTNTRTADNPSLEDLFEAECVALIEELSSSQFVSQGTKFLNKLMGTKYDLDEFRKIRERLNSDILESRSELVEAVYIIDMVALEEALLDKPLAPNIVDFYKLLGAILEPLLDFLRSRGVPLTKNRRLVVTEESKKKLDSERKTKIKELAEKICDQDQSDGWPEYYLKNVLDDDPYDVYVAFDDDVMTLNLFLRTWEPGEYFITETFDYHS